MKLREAGFSDFEPIRYIVEKTIKSIYPDYYPKGAVDFFLEYHCDESIKKALKEETVLLLEAGGNYVGTGSIRGNRVQRFFVLPEFQGRGYGTVIMNEIEKRIFFNHDEIILESSLPAYEFYLKRGYISFDFQKIKTSCGHMLCYHMMKKIKEGK